MITRPERFHGYVIIKQLKNSQTQCRIKYNNYEECRATDKGSSRDLYTPTDKGIGFISPEYHDSQRLYSRHYSVDKRGNNNNGRPLDLNCIYSSFISINIALNTIFDQKEVDN